MRQKGAIGWLKHDITTRGVTAWLLSALILAFYIFLYMSDKFASVPDYITPMAHAVGLDNKWTLYGLLYTIAIVAGGVYMLYKYSHNAYQVIRTCVVMFVQIVLAFSVPQILKIFDQPAFYFSYLWPLKIEYFYPSTLADMPILFVLWSILGSLVLVPVLGIFFGKRWYCSWVCGCGGLANTAGEPFRHLTSTRSEAWAFEKYAVHITLVVSFVLTGLVAASYLIGDSYPTLSTAANRMQSGYGLLVTAVLQGVIGVGLYPIGGTRIWCRNFCPMAALLGLIQKFGRFRITVKDDMCISCGLCTKYCEMGIDVRAYAQANQDFARAACVGCGMCEEVCPRGVLHLENKWEKDPQELTMSSLLSQSYQQ